MADCRRRVVQRVAAVSGQKSCLSFRSGSLAVGSDLPPRASGIWSHHRGRSIDAPEPPRMTRGTEDSASVARIRSRSSPVPLSLGRWTLPTEIAIASAPVSRAKRAASSGSVRADGTARAADKTDLAPTCRMTGACSASAAATKAGAAWVDARPPMFRELAQRAPSGHLTGKSRTSGRRSGFSIVATTRSMAAARMPATGCRIVISPIRPISPGTVRARFLDGARGANGKQIVAAEMGLAWPAGQEALYPGAPGVKGIVGGVRHGDRHVGTSAHRRRDTRRFWVGCGCSRQSDWPWAAGKPIYLRERTGGPGCSS